MPRLSQHLATCLALAAAAATSAQAGVGPVSTLYVASSTASRIYALRGSAVSASATAYCRNCESPIAVDGDVRTLSIFAGDHGGQYGLDLSKTGTVYAPPFADDSGARFNDGATDGTHNYAVGRVGTADRDSIYVFDRAWSDPQMLFSVGGNDSSSQGVTYDPTNHSLWATLSFQSDLGDYVEVVRDYAMDGTVLSQFFIPITDGAGLAMDYADGTLWTSDTRTRFFDQYSRSGQLLQSVTYDALVGQGSQRGLEFDLAGAGATTRGLPEPASLPLAIAALGLMAAFTRARRRAP